MRHAAAPEAAFPPAPALLLLLVQWGEGEEGQSHPDSGSGRELEGSEIRTEAVRPLDGSRPMAVLIEVAGTLLRTPDSG